MTKKDNTIKNRDRKKSDIPGFFIVDEIDISIEKRKAKELRKSTWWRKKSSSGICYYCGKKFLPYKLTMDHIIPISRGGKSERINMWVVWEKE